MFPEYQLRGVEETIRFHRRPEPHSAGFSYGKSRSIPAYLALSQLNETKSDAEQDLRDPTPFAAADVAEKARRERLLRHLESANKAHPLELAKYSLERAGASASEMDIKQ